MKIIRSVLFAALAFFALGISSVSAGDTVVQGVGDSPLLYPGQTNTIVGHWHVLPGQTLTLQSIMWQMYICSYDVNGACRAPSQADIDATAQIYFEIFVSDNATDLGIPIFTRYADVRTPERPAPWQFHNEAKNIDIIGEKWFTVRMQNSTSVAAGNARTVSTAYSLVFKRVGP